MVSFAEPAQTDTARAYPAFGWLLGPKVNLDPITQKLVPEQRIVPYQLHADLSIPGWWPYFDLRAYTAWAPDWRRAAANAGITLAMEQGKLERSVRIPMRHNTADMDALTALVLRVGTGQRVDRPKIRRIEPSRLFACTGAITLVIIGEGIWRATAIHVGGVKVASNSIEVLPNMGGIAATVNLSEVPMATSGAVKITVWTHNGSDTHELQCTPASIKKDAQN